MSGQQATIEILKDGLCRDPEGCRRALHREGAIEPACRTGGYAIDLNSRNAPAGSQQPNVLSFERTSAGRDEAFTVEYRGDFLVHFAGGVEFGDSFPQPFNVDVVAVSMDAPLQTMLAGGARLPTDPEPYLTS